MTWKFRQLLVEEVERLLPGIKVIDLKWVPHIKWNKDGIISCFKVQLVAKGFTQILGQDFTYTFAPVAHWDSIHAILTVGATNNFEI